MKKPFLYLLLAIALVSGYLTFSFSGHDKAPQTKSLKEWCDELYEEPENMADFDRMAADARKEGIPEVEIATAALLNACRLEDMDYLEKNYDKLNQILISAPEDTLPSISGMLRYYSLALLKWHLGDKAEAEKAFKEAFWSDPNSAAAIGKTVLNLKEKERWQKIQIPMDAPLLVGPDGPASLRQAMGNNEAILLCIWESWCGACKGFLPIFAELAASDEVKGIAHVALNTDPKTKEDAHAFLKEKAKNLTSYDEADGGDLSKLLKVSFMPTAALISADGKVLFLGNFHDARLFRAIDLVSQKLSN
jgi:thiol-disulfide isomerase/thioredoxin